jgi:hypothetical protein
MAVMTQYESYRAQQPTVTVRFPQLEPALRFLEEQQDEHFELVPHLCGAVVGHDSTPLFEVDIVLLSVLNRSLDLIDGFLATYDRWNLITAAPQVRMQVDNLLRITMLLVAPPNTVTKLLLSAERLSSHVDPMAPRAGSSSSPMRGYGNMLGRLAVKGRGSKGQTPVCRPLLERSR